MKTAYFAAISLFAIASVTFLPSSSRAASAAELEQSARTALNYLRKSRGWEVGTAPSLVVVDEGIAKSLSTTTLRKGIYVFFFDQRGLMGGLGVQGTKITRYEPSA